MYVEKPMSSKKFVAFLISEVTWKLLLGYAMFIGVKEGKIELDLFTVLLCIIAVAGFVEVGYMLGQASLDKYLKLAQIAKESGASIRTKEMTFDHAPQTRVDLEPLEPR